MIREHITDIKKNAPGKFHIGERCIGCTLCSEIAPHNFRADFEGHPEIVYSYVYKQPDNPDEEAQCAEALLNCPASAIKDDGDQNS